MSGFSWAVVEENIRRIAATRNSSVLDAGQRATLEFIADRIGRHGLVVADEVGCGKTRIACAVVRAVVEAGGRAAVVAPRGLMHQWRQQFAKLPARGRTLPPKELVSLQAWLDGPQRNPEDRPEWWLISHAFRYPLVRARTGPATVHDWRCALPSLVNVRLHPRLASDGRKALGRLRNDIAAGYLGPRWKRLDQMARRIARKVTDDAMLRRRLDGLKVLAPGWVVDRVREEFRSDGPGVTISTELVGVWLGRFDLVVVDEAHKSREPSLDWGADGTPVTVLGRLVAMVDAPGQRRLCLTATPMELDPGQWMDLLRRAKTGASRGQVKAAIEELRTSLADASAAPDERRKVARAITASKVFERELEEFVTRRRALDPELRASLRAHRPDAEDPAHPHRGIGRELVSLASQGAGGEEWREMVVALEGVSSASRGLVHGLLGHQASWAKTLYTKIATGHVSADDIGDLRKLLKANGRGLPPDAQAKLQRIRFWAREFERADARLEAGATRRGIAHVPEAAFPRIVETVRAIEKWTERGEKVLVFGVFKRPMRVLRDVLEVRHCLRAIDAGRAIAIPVHRNPRLRAIAWGEYESHLGRWTGRLGGRKRSPKALVAASRQSFRSYERTRRAIREELYRTVEPLVQQDLPDAGSALRLRLREALRIFVLEGWLAGGGASAPSREQIRALVAEAWRTYVVPVTEVDEGAPPERESQDYAQRPADRVSEWLDAVLDPDSADTMGHVSRGSGWSRLLDGDTAWHARRTIQAGFNRSDGYPRVLIAQSQVGREGLDLHLACKTVVQFHAEWNPAVLEQQIGRVDRLDSRWRKEYERWRADGGELPLIEVRSIVFEGTYDAYQWQVVQERRRGFDATLFGTLLPAEAWSRVPPDLCEALEAAAPDFDPARPRIRAPAVARTGT